MRRFAPLKNPEIFQRTFIGEFTLAIHFDNGMYINNWGRGGGVRRRRAWLDKSRGGGRINGEFRPRRGLF